MKKLAALNLREECFLIERIASKPGSPIRQEEIEAIQRGFHRIQGF